MEELVKEAEEKREWAKEDRIRSRECGDQHERAVLEAKADACEHFAEQCDRIVKGMTAGEFLARKLKS